MEPPLDIVVYRATKDKVLLCLDLLKMAQLENPVCLVNLVIHLRFFLKPKAYMNLLKTSLGEYEECVPNVSVHGSWIMSPSLTSMKCST
jgi:hypothetical protein